jgi:hypothetical protein
MAKRVNLTNEMQDGAAKAAPIKKFGKISQSKIKEMLDKISIVEVMTGSPYGLFLDEKGDGTWVGCCCFHDDHSPSMIVYDNTCSYHCWSCGANGNLLNFFQEIDGDSFPQALNKLSNLVGMPIGEYEPDVINDVVREVKEIVKNTLEVKQTFLPFGLTMIEMEKLLSPMTHQHFKDCDKDPVEAKWCDNLHKMMDDLWYELDELEDDEKNGIEIDRANVIGVCNKISELYFKAIKRMGERKRIWRENNGK